jgi:hypothetical protein
LRFALGGAVSIVIAAAAAVPGLLRLGQLATDA